MSLNYLRTLWLCIAVLAVTVVSGCASNSKRVEVHGLEDNLAGSITVSTFHYQRPFMGIVNPSDYFFRLIYDKEVQLPAYHLYVITNKAGWMGWNEARFIRNENPESVRANVVSRDVQCSQYGCAHFEDTVIHLDKEIIETWASSLEDITVRLASKRSTGTIDIEINPEEAKAFLSEVARVLE